MMGDNKEGRGFGQGEGQSDLGMGMLCMALEKIGSVGTAHFDREEGRWFIDVGSNNRVYLGTGAGPDAASGRHPIGSVSH